MREAVVVIARNTKRARPVPRDSLKTSFTTFLSSRTIVASMRLATYLGDKWKSRGGAIRFDTCRMLAIERAV